MEIIYSIPVKVVSSNSALKCTIPKEIANKMNIKKGDRLIWIYYDNNIVEVRKETHR